VERVERVERAAGDISLLQPHPPGSGLKKCRSELGNI
jgi:hypothetical protein